MQSRHILPRHIHRKILCHVVREFAKSQERPPLPIHGDFLCFAICEIALPELLPCKGLGSAGSTSGLHHDYHDNLYVLLRGRKTVRLFPPSLADRLYTYGTIELVHPNGRIVYKGQVSVHCLFWRLFAREYCTEMVDPGWILAEWAALGLVADSVGLTFRRPQS